MRGKRMWHTLRLFTILSSVKRTQYYKDKSIFHSMGDNCLIMDRRVPLYAKLICIGNNVNIASDVHFVTHDIIHRMINNMPLEESGGVFLHEKTGCIEIGDNVFIGTGTTIMPDVRVGSNVIIGAGSLVTNDVPDCSVVVGVPARVISSIDEFLKKRSEQDCVLESNKESIDDDIIEKMWELFNKKRNSQTG